jgi:hypothetical protein
MPTQTKPPAKIGPPTWIKPELASLVKAAPEGVKWRQEMKLAEEFRQNAEEWRQIGKIAATDDHRRRIAEVADT